MIYFGSAVFLIVGVCVLTFALWPVLRYRAKTSQEIRESVFPGLVDVYKTFITVASAAIVLTVQFGTEKLDRTLLVPSWYFFFFSIGTGVIGVLSHFSLRYVDRTMIKAFQIANDETTVENLDSAKKLLEIQKQLTVATIVLSFAQGCLLLLAMSFLIVAGLQACSPVPGP